MQHCLNALDTYAKRIRTLEEEALKALHCTDDQERHRTLMEEKAHLLARLPQEIAPYLTDLPQHARAEIQTQCSRFAQSARHSLDLHSVFYMSALLYPDEHQQGEPNNFDLWLSELKSTYQASIKKVP